MHLTLHLTPACNLRCSYCYAPPRPGAAMTPETARTALELAAALTPGGSCGIVLFGGEPLLERELIHEIVAIARSLERNGLRFHFKVTTNGLLLDDEFLELAVREEILVALSCDGVAAAHDAHRRLPDGSPTHARLLPRLERLLQVRPYSSVLLVVNPDTVRHLVESVTFLLDRSVRYLIVSLNHAAAWQEQELKLLERQYRELGELYVRWSRAGRKFYLSPFEVKLASHIRRHHYRQERCELGRRQLSVDPQGYLFPCVQFTRGGPDSSWCIGHVQHGIDEAARRRIAAESELEQEQCRDCAVQERCNHTCGCLNWQATGTIRLVSPLLCAHERMLLPIADRVGEQLYRRRCRSFLRKHYDPAYPLLSLVEDQT